MQRKRERQYEAPGRPSKRYDRFLALWNAVLAAEGGPPTYSRVCRTIGIGDRSTVRQLVVYGERRGDLARRGVP